MAKTTAKHVQGRAVTIRKSFSRTTSVAVDILADPEVIWGLITNASDFPRWNSTVVSMEGRIEPGQTIRLKSVLDEKRIFKLRITNMAPAKAMTWQDGMAPFFKGVRQYLLTPVQAGATRFTMTEKIGGLMFPMAARHIPDFNPVFEQFANDLKKEAETIQKAKN